MNLLLFFELLLLFVLTEPSRQLDEIEINFAVLAPNSINLNQDYSIIINVAESERPVSFKANLYISKDSNNPFITQEVVVLPNESKVCVFQSNDILSSIHLETFKSGDKLILQVFAIDFPYSSIVTDVQIKKMNAPLVLFQRDKERYNIGEKVNYQITIVDENYRPLNQINSLQITRRSSDYLTFIPSFISSSILYTNKLAVNVR